MKNKVSIQIKHTTVHVSKPLACVYLCEGPPVHVGTSNVNMLLIHNPELCVKDT